MNPGFDARAPGPPQRKLDERVPRPFQKTLKSGLIDISTILYLPESITVQAARGMHLTLQNRGLLTLTASHARVEIHWLVDKSHVRFESRHLGDMPDASLCSGTI